MTTEATTVLIAMIVVYMLPTVISALRLSRNMLAIFFLNLLLGWTFVGWVVALVWAVLPGSRRSLAAD
jgi:hypothetical protein